MNKKQFLSGALALSIFSTCIISATAPVQAHTSQILTNTSSTNSIKDKVHYLYNELSDSKKQEFNILVNGANLTLNDQLEILKERDKEINAPITRGAKASVIKKVAKWLAIKTGEKSVADITDYLFEWEDNLKQGTENFLVENCGFSKTVAHWTVKTVAFIFL